MNWTEPTERETRIAAAIEWERREFGPLEDVARQRQEAARTSRPGEPPRALELVRTRSPRRLALVRSLFSGGRP